MCGSDAVGEGGATRDVGEAAVLACRSSNRRLNLEQHSLAIATSPASTASTTNLGNNGARSAEEDQGPSCEDLAAQADRRARHQAEESVARQAEQHEEEALGGTGGGDGEVTGRQGGTSGDSTWRQEGQEVGEGEGGQEVRMVQRRTTPPR